MVEKRIGTVELLKVKSSGRSLYVRLSAELIETFDVKKGDVLKVEFKSLIKRNE